MKPLKVLFLIFAILFTASIFCINPAFSQEKPEVTNFIIEDGLSPGMPVSISKDPGGWIWIGTDDPDKKDNSGLSIINPNYKVISFNKDKGIGGSIYSIAFDRKAGLIWLGTSNGLAYCEAKTGSWKILNSSNSPITENRVNTVYVDNEGNKYIGTNGGGLYIIKAGGLNVEKLKSPFNSISAILIDSKGRLWVTSKEGAGYRQGEIWVTYNEDNSTLASSKVDSITEGPDKNIYCATSKGISIFNNIGWRSIDTSNSSLPVDQVTTIQFDDDGNLWASTWGGGVAKFDSTLSKATVYSRKNVDIMDNRISALAFDNDKNLWLCTARGVAKLAANPKAQTSKKIQSATATAYSWGPKTPPENAGEVRFQAGLPKEHIGRPVWSWAAFISKKGYDTLESPVTIESDAFGNNWLNVPGIFTDPVDFIQASTFEGEAPGKVTRDKAAAYPFPDNMPAEVQIYLKPGLYIPSDDPEIRKLSSSMVRDYSRGDMLRTAQDIVLSNLFAQMAYEPDTAAGEMKDGVVITDPREKIVKTADQVLKDNSGGTRSKTRLAVALLRATGVPARILASNGGAFLGEAYINNLGWVPFDVSMPVFSIFEEKVSRMQFPCAVSSSNMDIVSVSGAGDNIKTFFWRPAAEALVIHGEDLLKTDTEPGKLSGANFFVVYPAENESMPTDAKIPVSNTISMIIRKEGGKYSVKFFDRANNKMLKKVPIEAFGRSIDTGIDGRVRISFIPDLIGRYMILRINGWKISD